MKITLAIIAGGKGSRMNYKNKAFLEINNSSFIENIIKEGQIFDDIIVITNDFTPYENLVKKYNIKLFEDIYKDKGPIGGIYSALINSKFDRVFCVACDMPNIDKNIFREVLEIQFNEEVLVSSINKKFQPLFSIYKKSLINKIENHIENNNLKLKNLIFNSSNKIIELKVDETKFLNINTIDEYEKLKNNENIKN